MKKTLYIMRHGQTLFNQQQRIQGWCDSPLTEEGKQQALKAREYFQKEGITFDECYASTQERASDTLELVTNHAPYTRLKGIKEWNFGKFEGASEYLNPPRNRKGQQSYEDYFVAYDGESNVEVAKRVRQTLDDIFKEDESKTVLAVSHGGAMWAFFLSLNLKEHPTYLSSNCSIHKYEVEDGHYQLVKVIDPVNGIVHDLEDQTPEETLIKDHVFWQ